MRHTKIVATIGPASRAPAVLERLIAAGVDVVRLNFSHGTHADHLTAITNVRQIAERAGRSVAILQDLCGPKIRIGALKDGAPITLDDHAVLEITTDESVLGSRELIPTTYDLLPRDVHPGDRILLDDGNLELSVTGVRGERVQCRVVHGGLLKPHKGMNLPGVALSTPALTDKDKEDLAFGVAHSVDYVALSFVRTPNDLAITKDHIRSLGRAIPVIAKIEKREAIDALDAIIAAADGVMVARGDLGVELSTEEVPSLQKRIIAAANATGRVVITATQMLESMIESPRPTRAEASDVANAILDGTDAVMLSAETASGRFPVEAVETMARVALYTEEHQQQRAPEDVTGAASRVASSLAHVAKHVAADLGCRLIVVFTSSGLTAQLVAAYRPRVPIAALTPSEGSYRRLALWRGVIPLRAPITQTTDEMLARGENILCASGLARAGDTVVMLAGQALSAGATNMLRVHTL